MCLCNVANHTAEDDPDARYWPNKNERVRKFGDISVTWESETTNESFVKTILLVSRDKQVSPMTRVVAG